ncbi:MAG: hypothetical protein NC344_04005 [Bacteroidales bacterium]|nr:hypothetical protein [Bacteroidales bacterium]MCM1146992.1 hypothetical protein [Bacteroidales bacterium]MCM1205875.1 hypothetical protein [Bacillota bacterium]MCM1509884.1 hypothetical protein [Clostridium sp.]
MRRFQNNIGASRLALPVMVLYSVCLWGLMLFTDHTLWPQCLIFIVSTYLMMELNNRNALMRRYSRMVSCSYMALMLMCPWLLRDIDAMAVQMCFLLTLTMLFRTYQDHGSNGVKYGAYLFLGIAGMLWPPLIFALPLLWIADIFFLMSFSFRSWLASLLAVITPLWCLLPYVVITGKYEILTHLLNALELDSGTLEAFRDINTVLLSELPMPPQVLCSEILVVILAVTGIIHFLRHSSDDKIHVRMLFNVFNIIFLAFTAALFLLYILPLSDMPGADILFGIIVVCATPLTAHYINFTSTRLTNISVILAMLLVLAFTTLHHLQEWLIL